MLWVAYDAWGDLVADGYSLAELLRRVEASGYYEDEVLIGRVTP